MTNHVLADNPLLSVLGRRGRGAVVDVLRAGGPEVAWTVRALARAAAVPAGVVARAVRELETLRAVEVLRPGRDAAIRWLPETPAGRALQQLAMPDLRGEVVAAFRAAYDLGRVRAVAWQAPGDHAADPGTPTRIALLAGAPEAALDAAGPALDAVRRAGLPAPELTAWNPRTLDPHDPVARAILAGS